MYELYGEGELYERFLPRQRLGSKVVIKKQSPIGHFGWLHKAFLDKYRSGLYNG